MAVHVESRPPEYAAMARADGAGSASTTSSAVKTTGEY